MPTTTRTSSRSSRSACSEAGFEVATAADGDEAVEIARARRPALAVLDVMMPKRTGYEVLAELRGDPALREMKVILLSARVQEGDVARGMDAGADAYLAKPFKARALRLTPSSD